MRSLGTRRAALVAGAATVAALALGGCSAGQVAETAILDTPIAGVNADSSDGKVLVRNLQVEYNGIKGYEARENAPLELSLYNETNETVTVTISSQPTDRPTVVSGTQVGFVSTATVTTPGEVAGGSASAEPGASAEPASSAETSASAAPSADAEPASTVRPAQIKLDPQGAAVFRPTDAVSLQIVGLSGELKPGMTVNLVFEFSNDATPLIVQAPVASPLTPAPRGSAEIHEEGAEGGH
jgi:hypothetical protein